MAYSLSHLNLGSTVRFTLLLPVTFSLVVVVVFSNGRGEGSVFGAHSQVYQ